MLAAALFAFVILFHQARSPTIRSPSCERALKAGEFVPYYQPVVDITNGRVRGAEVLMRWRKPDGTIVSPVGLHPARGIERAHPGDDARRHARGAR